MSVERALSMLVNAARVSPPLREAVATVEDEIRRLRDEVIAPAGVSEIRTWAVRAMSEAAIVERVAYLLWQVNEGYLTAEDRAVGTNWFAEPAENLHPDDQAERPHWIALAEEVIAEVRTLDSGRTG